MLTGWCSLILCPGPVLVTTDTKEVEKSSRSPQEVPHQKIPSMLYIRILALFFYIGIPNIFEEWQLLVRKNIGQSETDLTVWELDEDSLLVSLVPMFTKGAGVGWKHLKHHLELGWYKRGRHRLSLSKSEGGGVCCCCLLCVIWNGLDLEGTQHTTLVTPVILACLCILASSTLTLQTDFTWTDSVNVQAVWSKSARFVFWSSL